MTKHARTVELWISLEPSLPGDARNLPVGYRLKAGPVRRPSCIARTIRAAIRRDRWGRHDLGGALGLAGLSADAIAAHVWARCQEVSTADGQPTALQMRLTKPAPPAPTWRDTATADLWIWFNDPARGRGEQKWATAIHDLTGREAVALRRLRRAWRRIPEAQRASLVACGETSASFAAAALRAFRLLDAHRPSLEGRQLELRTSPADWEIVPVDNFRTIEA